MKKVPFRTVFLHAIVVDEHGDKMSKVKGNVIDPLDVMHGATVDELLKKAKDLLSAGERAREHQAVVSDGDSARGCRRAALHAGGAGGAGPQHPAVDPLASRGYRHFANKLWNAARFGLGEHDRLRSGSLRRRATRGDGDRGADAVRSLALSRTFQRTAREVDENLEVVPLQRGGADALQVHLLAGPSCATGTSSWPSRSCTRTRTR